MMNEHWTSHANEVLAGDKFSDDCDGFANTCAELLIKEGIDKKDVSVIYCVTETGEDHLVCGVAIEGKTWILENRYNKCYDWAGSFKPGKYEWKYFMKFDDPGQWFKVNN
jgi:predicted transglutaminase-like cysteine proteinase